jgi:hypothetical protein
MKEGKPFEEVVAAVQSNAQRREDYVVHLGACRIESTATRSLWKIEGLGDYAATPVFHDHLAEYFGIGWCYYQEMQEMAPELLDRNINTWIEKRDAWLDTSQQSRLVRTLQPTGNTNDDEAKGDNGSGNGGVARALLSPSYLPLDDAEMLQALHPVFKGKKLKVESCEITDRRTYIKIVSPRLKADVKVGDVVQAGVMISNSELGFGAIRVQHFLKRLVCLNGMIVPEKETELRRPHLGVRQKSEQPFYKMFENGDRKEATAAIWNKVGEAVGAVLDGARFQELVERMQAAEKLALKAETDKLVERVGERFGLLQSERQTVMQHYEREGERTLWGLANAVTRTANDLEDYERATELETMGGRIVQLSERDLTHVASTN